MRLTPAAVALSLVLTFASPAVRAGSPAPCVEWTNMAPLSPLTFYPPAALAAHLSGSATIKCGRTEHDVMTDCQVASEEPRGKGFGEAALSLAARSKEAPSATLSLSQRRPRSVTFRFRADAPCITPNVIGLPWMPTEPEYERYPDVFEFARARSLGKAENAESGRAVMSCKVEVSGHLTGCEIADESPKGAGFGTAALLLAQYMVIRRTTRDGVPVVGERLTIGVPFSVPRAVGRQ